MPDPAPQPVSVKLFQSVFWFISCLPSLGHFKDHAADDYVGRTSPLLGTTFAFWVCAVALIVLVLMASGALLQQFAWRGMDTAVDVAALFLVVLYIAGFWMFWNREGDYPN